MSINGNRSFAKALGLKRSVVLVILIAGMAIGLGACTDNDDRGSNPTAPPTAPPSGSAPLTNVGKNTTFSIDIINGQPIPKSGPVVVKAPYVTMGGWAVDQQAQTEAGGVYVTVDGKTDAPTEYGIERKDVADINKNPRYLKSGFAASISTANLAKGRHTLGLKILTADKKGYYEPDKKIEIDLQ